MAELSISKFNIDKLRLVANGMTADDIIAAYPYLESEDIRQALQYAARLAEESI